MSVSSTPLWATGPGELLQHGINLLESDSEPNRRIAMILIDNAVELILQTYITLPERVTGLGISRKEREECCRTFPSLLDGAEKYAADKLVGLNLGEFEWFHRLRNRLYHEGNGLTVETRNVLVYSELAEKLFEALFDCKLDIKSSEADSTKLIGEFFERWIEIERNLSLFSKDGRRYSNSMIVSKLVEEGKLTDKDLEAFREIQIIRNQLVHGEAEPEEMLRPTNMDKIKEVGSTIQKVLGTISVLSLGAL